MTQPTRILSWGCGVQSTVIAELALEGQIPPIDIVLNIDLHWDRQVTYGIRNYYMKRWKGLGQRVVILNGGNIRQIGLGSHQIPFWTTSGGALKRQCTIQKIQVAHRWIREYLGYPASTPPHPPPGSIDQMIGITTDETRRATPSRVKYITLRWPLIELGMSRQNCADYYSKKGLPLPPKSACVCCPLRSTAGWLEIKQEATVEWEEVCNFDETNRRNSHILASLRKPTELFLYRDTHKNPRPLRTL